MSGFNPLNAMKKDFEMMHNDMVALSTQMKELRSDLRIVVKALNDLTRTLQKKKV